MLTRSWLVTRLGLEVDSCYDQTPKNQIKNILTQEVKDD